VRVLRYVMEFSHRLYKTPYGCYCALCRVLLTSCAIQNPFLFKPVMHIWINQIAHIYIYIYIYIYIQTFSQYRISYPSDNHFRRQTQNLSFSLLFRCQSVIFTAKYSILPSIFHTKISVLVVLMYLNFYPWKHRVYVLIMQPNDKHLIQHRITGLRQMHIFFSTVERSLYFHAIPKLITLFTGARH
jgi:hypothetical protein